MFEPENLFDLSQTNCPDLFDGCASGWEALKQIAPWLEANLRPSLKGALIGRTAVLAQNVFVGEGTVIEDGAMIKGPAWIGRNCEIRHGAYVRESVIIGDGCIIGHATEVKNSILFNGAAASHFNYVGDSILGFKAHLGAGVKISNVKLVEGNIMVQTNEGLVDTGLHKFGALLGDHAEVGCNTVLNPGSVVGRRGVIYPNTNWRGVLLDDCVAKNKAPIQVIRRAAPGEASR